MPRNLPKSVTDYVTDPSVRRRDFINIAAVSAAGVSALATLIPIIGQMWPSAEVLAATNPLSVDISTLQPGQQIVVSWRSTPKFIVNRTAAELATLRELTLVDRLRDPESRERQQPDSAANWHRSIKPEYLVLMGICTHLGCVPEYKPEPGAIDNG